MSYSAKVKAWLEQDGQQINLSHTGPGYCLMRPVVPVRLGESRLCISIDGACEPVEVTVESVAGNEILFTNCG